MKFSQLLWSLPLVVLLVLQGALKAHAAQEDTAKDRQERLPEEGIARMIVPFPEGVEEEGHEEMDQPRMICGDGYLDPGEECDDGNFLPNDGCSPDCRREPRCGDGVIDPDEECDDGNTRSGDGCSSQCQLELAYCGNGVVEEDEQCDDGNRSPGDGCSSDCKIEVVCGDGTVGKGETCDDGNTQSGDGCSSTCQLEICGDGIVQPWEQCEREDQCPSGTCVDCQCQGCSEENQCQSDTDCASGQPRLVGNDCVCATGVCQESRRCPGISTCQEGDSRGGCWDSIFQRTQTVKTPEGCEVECQYEVRTCGESQMSVLTGKRITGGTYDVPLGQQIIQCFCTSGRPSGTIGDTDESNACAAVTITPTCPPAI